MRRQFKILIIIALPILYIFGNDNHLSNYVSKNYSSDYIYHNSILNITFKISTPLKYYADYIDEIDISTWKNFKWSINSINIKYPPYFNIEKHYTERVIEVFDTVINFNFYNIEDSSNNTIVRFFLTNDNFDEVAFSLGFDTTSTMHKIFSHIKENESVWITHGIMPILADSIVGFPWSGLRGTIEERGIGFGYDDFMFLYFKNEVGRNIVFEYGNNIKSKCKFYEGDFIKMVENFYLEYLSN